MEEKKRNTITAQLTPLDNLIQILTWISNQWKNEEITTQEMAYLVKQRCKKFNYFLKKEKEK